MTENAADESDIHHPLNQKAESTNHQKTCNGKIPFSQKASRKFSCKISESIYPKRIAKEKQQGKVTVELCPTLASKGEMLGFIRW